jgi:hypothetical protein
MQKYQDRMMADEKKISGGAKLGENFQNFYL